MAEVNAADKALTFVRIGGCQKLGKFRFGDGYLSSSLFEFTIP